MKSRPLTPDPTPRYTIGELAAKFDLPTHVLRHWEAAGVLHPARLENGRRRYGPADVARLSLVVHSRRVGFSLPEIRAMVDAPDGEARLAVLREKQAALAAQEREIAATRQMIEHAMECPENDVSNCPGFQALVTRLTEDPAAVAPRWHPHHRHHAHHHSDAADACAPPPRRP